LIHIFREWIKNQQNPEWAEKNYLSSETLIEATNIKNELLKIAKENGGDILLSKPIKLKGAAFDFIISL
ncbi:MAG: hypothetical protein N2445_08580, partial [Acidobacteria bacterium]|nr:hypothetical protein [Acidobacteriota bacterium]